FNLLLQVKQKGFGDRQIAHIIGCLESEVHEKRQELGIHRAFMKVDTCSEAFDFFSPYFYSSFGDSTVTTKEQLLELNQSQPTSKKKVIVLGSGPNRIGQGIEFDYCCVHGVLAAEEEGYETIMINCNPETVSTDYDTANKLYFES